MLNVRIGHPGAGGHHSRFGGGDGAVEGDGYLMFRDGQQDVERRFLGEERLQGQTDDAAQAALTGGQLVIGVAVQRPGRGDLLQRAQRQGKAGHVLQFHGGKLHAQQGSQLGLGDVAAHAPARQHQPRQRCGAHDFVAQVGVELPGVVEGLLGVDVYPRKGIASLSGRQCELELARRILTGNGALRRARLLQDAVEGGGSRRQRRSQCS